MRTMLTTLLKSMLVVAILTVTSIAWGNQLVSPNVNFGEIFGGKPIVVDAEEHTYSLGWTENEDATFTVTLYVDEVLGGFDYGIAFSPEEVTVVEYGFTEPFKDHYIKQQGSVIDHYFNEGKRVSETAQYIVYGGMATKTAAYDGEVCCVTVSLKGEQASIYAVKDSARYEHASELMAGGVSCTLVKEENSSNGNDSQQEDLEKDEMEETSPEKEISLEEENSSEKDTSAEKGTSSEKGTSTEKTSQNSGGSNASKNNEASTSHTKNLQTVKTGDNNLIVQYLLAIALASFVIIIMGRKIFQKNWKNPKET